VNKKHFLNKITCLIYFTIISFNWCFGQNNYKSENEFGWVNLGLGGSSYGISFGINGSYQIKKNLISLRYINNVEFVLLCSTPNKIRDLGLLYGLSAKKSKGFASISIGISHVENIRRGKLISCSSSGGWFSTCTYEELNYTTLGIPIEAQLFLTGKYVGIGIYGFANLNPESSFFGALLCIQLGKLK